ncbi:MAG: hypothetical protein ABJM58_06055, partial [Alteripontixanthobacter sp.]
TASAATAIAAAITAATKPVAATAETVAAAAAEITTAGAAAEGIVTIFTEPIAFVAAAASTPFIVTHNSKRTFVSPP